MRPLFKERRDWTLLILILPLGIIFMLIAGQVAIRLMPSWRVSADISSKVNPGDYLDTNNLPDSFAPVRFEILTPMSWADSFLTPQAQVTDAGVVPFVVLNPSATPTSPTTVPPSPSSTPPTVTTPSPTGSPTSSPTGAPTASPTIQATGTKEPGDPPPSTPGPTSTPPGPTASPTSNPPPTSTAVTLPTVTPSGSEPDIQAPPDGTIYALSDGYAIVIDLGLANAIIVTGNPETNYDLVYYERLITSPDHIDLDWIQIDISISPSGPAYTVFHWGDGVRDTNTNVDTADIGVPAAEADNQSIPTSYLYGTSPQTGILIDVDGAPTPPPPGAYQFVIFSAPAGAGSAGDGTDIDSVQTVNIPQTGPPIAADMDIGSVQTEDTSPVGTDSGNDGTDVDSVQTEDTAPTETDSGNGGTDVESPETVDITLVP